MNLVGLQFHPSGGHRQFRKVQFRFPDRRIGYSDLNQASIATVLHNVGRWGFAAWIGAGAGGPQQEHVAQVRTGSWITAARKSSESSVRPPQTEAGWPALRVGGPATPDGNRQ
jgi:hypothetical protein